MTRYAIDAPVALRLIRDGSDAGGMHRLVGPAVLRSDALSLLYAEAREGRLDETAVRGQLDGVAALKIRLLGDRVSRATAWKIAAELEWDDTRLAEYLAVAVLQADALVTANPLLRSAAEGRIPIAAYDALQR